MVLARDHKVTGSEPCGSLGVDPNICHSTGAELVYQRPGGV